jgi:hypothetical protein
LFDNSKLIDIMYYTYLKDIFEIISDLFAAKRPVAGIEDSAVPGGSLDATASCCSIFPMQHVRNKLFPYLQRATTFFKNCLSRKRPTPGKYHTVSVSPTIVEDLSITDSPFDLDETATLVPHLKKK